MQPNCPRCKSTNITWTSASQKAMMGYYVYCGDCGAIITWIPEK